VVTTLNQWHLDRLRDDAELLVSEVVTNALVHARTDELHLVVRRFDEGVRVEVEDGGGGPTPRRRAFSHTAVNGRGLGLVDTSAAAWGTERTSFGKVVWFELRSD
jgi:signal transduction histidine kinase